MNFWGVQRNQARRLPDSFFDTCSRIQRPPRSRNHRWLPSTSRIQSHPRPGIRDCQTLVLPHPRPLLPSIPLPPSPCPSYSRRHSVLALVTAPRPHRDPCLDKKPPPHLCPLNLLLTHTAPRTGPSRTPQHFTGSQLSHTGDVHAHMYVTLRTSPVHENLN